MLYEETLEHEFLGVRIMKEILEHESWSTNPGGVCIMKEILEHESWGSMYHEPKIIKNPGKIVICTIPQDFPSPRFFGKKRWKRETKQSCLEHECPWRTNFPGERILGNPHRKNCAGKIMVRKPRQKNSGKQTSAICSLPRIVSVKLVVIGMVLKPVHKWSWDCQFMLIPLNPPNWFESRLIFKSNGKRYPLIVDNLYHLFKMIKSQTWRTNNFLVCDKVWRMAFAGLELYSLVGCWISFLFSQVLRLISCNKNRRSHKEQKQNWQDANPLAIRKVLWG